MDVAVTKHSMIARKNRNFVDYESTIEGQSERGDYSSYAPTPRYK